MGEPATPERLAALRQALAEGLSWTDIGKRLGCTKNAVAGLVRRHIYGKSNSYRNPALADRPHKEYSREKKPIVPKAETRPAAKPLPPPPILPVFECQWPLSDERPWLFCCAPAEFGFSYCRKHCRIGYSNWTPKL